jgi:hypothetical protein
MSVTIPPASGVPGINGPPNWLDVPPTGNFRLDDVRWIGATERTFGGGASQSASFRALHATVGAQKFIYLSFRAAFVAGLSDQADAIFLGLQKHGGTQAMVIKLKLHGPLPPHSGPPPDNNAPVTVNQVTVWTRTAPATTWMLLPMANIPAWINNNVRLWLQSNTDVPDDENNRWAVQMRIPLTGAADITDNMGPNLGDDFDMWYVVRGSTSALNSVILAEYPNLSTSPLALNTAEFPLPNNWDEFILSSSGPATDGGVTLYWNDVVVQNIYGEGWTIANGQVNSFVCRPRNYSGADIPAGNITATFRIANWGSTASGYPDFATGQWDYVPSDDPMSKPNDPLRGVPSSAVIPMLTAPNNPPNTAPINLPSTLNLGAGKSIHQCILVTMSGTSLNFLQTSVYTNMDFDHASLLNREAEISVVGLTPFSPQPRDVYLAIEKINMLRNLPPGANEGRFLESSMARLIEQGGALAKKLSEAQSHLGRNEGDYGSIERLDNLLNELRRLLANLSYDNPRERAAALDQLISSLRQWLLAVKANEGSANRLAAVLDALTDWLSAADADAEVKLNAFITQINQWLSALGADPASIAQLIGVVTSLIAWLYRLADAREIGAAIEQFLRWLSSGRPPAQLTEILEDLRARLAALPVINDETRGVITTFSRAFADWLKSKERLDVFVNVLSDVGLTNDDLDQLFPTFRVHVYHDTGERETGTDGISRPALRAQSSFGLYTYHEGALEGWQTSIQGARRIADNLYLLAVPNNGSSKVNVRIQAVEPGQERIPEDPIRPIEPEHRGGCWGLLLKLLRALLKLLRLGK